MPKMTAIDTPYQQGYNAYPEAKLCENPYDREPSREQWSRGYMKAHYESTVLLEAPDAWPEEETR